MRITFYKQSNNDESIVCSVSTAKRYIKKLGGYAWTEHFDRDGSFQESTPIVLANNKDTTYNAKYNTSKCYNNQYKL